MDWQFSAAAFKGDILLYGFIFNLSRLFLQCPEIGSNASKRRPTSEDVNYVIVGILSSLNVWMLSFTVCFQATNPSCINSEAQQMNTFMQWKWTPPFVCWLELKCHFFIEYQIFCIPLLKSSAAYPIWLWRGVAQWIINLFGEGEKETNNRCEMGRTFGSCTAVGSSLSITKTILPQGFVFPLTENHILLSLLAECFDILFPFLLNLPFCTSCELACTWCTFLLWTVWCFVLMQGIVVWRWANKCQVLCCPPTPEPCCS